MNVYLGNILLLILYANIFLYSTVYRNKKIFCILASTNWIVLSGLRDWSVGADTLAYKYYSFDVVIYNSWSDLWSNFLDIYFRGVPGKDPGYKFFEKFFQLFSSSYQVYLIFIALVFTVALGRWIYLNSSDPFISFLIYSTLFYSFFAITGHRQTIATALVSLIGYEAIKQRKLKKFIFITLIAFTIHKSAFAFIPFYFLANKKITSKYLLFSLFSIPLAFFLRKPMIMIFAYISNYESYARQFEGAGTWTFSFLIILVLLVSVWRYKIILKNSPLGNHYINALILAVWLTPLTFIDPNTMRLVQYYSIYIMLLIPEIIASFTKKEKLLVYLVASIAIIFLFIRTAPYYKFFWQ